METTVPILIGVTAAVLLCLGAIFDDRRARARRRAQREDHERALPLLHSINDDRCIGCEDCVDVCPTEVLDLVDHKVRVARFSDCVQCEQCANACPTQALVMYREGTTPRMLTVPELDEHFQTGVPGQYLIGEVAGKPLVKNAANLGRAVIEHIARELAHGPGTGRGDGVLDVLDVLIVGSGPGGLSAGLTCKKRRLSCLVLEKEHTLASTVARYPKGKHFMAEPCTSQNVSYLPVFDGTKEELVAAWRAVAEGAKLPIKLGEAVETVQRGDDGIFTIKSTVGSYRARTVVLATGLRGKPRLLAVPGANLEKVMSLLDDPAEFAGEAVLVVGGGDSAVEGAMALADAGATVTLSYRGDGFKRCKQGNQKRLAEMTANQRLTVLLESNVTRFSPDRVTIALADKSETTIENQRAFVLIGADTPVAWLETNHVRFVERPHLYALGSSEDAVRRLAPDAAECPRSPAEALAILFDRPAPRRMRSVVDHLRDEFREVVTSVSATFRLSDLEPRRDGRRARTKPPARGSAELRASARIIPAARLTASRPSTTPVHHGTTGPGTARPQLTAISATPLLPRAAHRRARASVAGAAGTTMLQLPAVAGEITTRTSSPEPRTDEMASLRRALEEPTEELALRARAQQPQQIAMVGRASAGPKEGSRSRAEDQTEEIPSLRVLERWAAVKVAPPYEFEDSIITELGSLTTDTEMRSIRTLDRTTIAEVLSLRTLDGSLDTAAPPGDAEHPWAQTDDDHATPMAPERRTPSVVTSAIRPLPLPRRPARLARGSTPLPHHPALPPPAPQRTLAVEHEGQIVLRRARTIR